MGRTFSYSLDISGHRVREISVNWGLRTISDIRRESPAFGTDIEMPAVIELLDLVAAGVVPVEKVRDALIEIATEVNKEQDREYEHHLEGIHRAHALKVPPQPKPADMRWVYAVSSVDNPKVIKIGVASNVDRRIKSLQTGAATQILLRWSARGGLQLESHLHETFHKKRMSGEWFDFRRVRDPVEMIASAANRFYDRQKHPTI